MVDDQYLRAVLPQRHDPLRHSGGVRGRHDRDRGLLQQVRGQGGALARDHEGARERSVRAESASGECERSVRAERTQSRAREGHDLTYSRARASGASTKEGAGGGSTTSRTRRTGTKESAKGGSPTAGWGSTASRTREHKRERERGRPPQLDSPTNTLTCAGCRSGNHNDVDDHHRGVLGLLVRCTTLHPPSPYPLLTHPAGTSRCLACARSA